jgi:hypothetical protein
MTEQDRGIDAGVLSNGEHDLEILQIVDSVLVDVPDVQFRREEAFFWRRPHGEHGKPANALEDVRAHVKRIKPRGQDEAAARDDVAVFGLMRRGRMNGRQELRGIVADEELVDVLRFGSRRLLGQKVLFEMIDIRHRRHTHWEDWHAGRRSRGESAREHYTIHLLQLQCIGHGSPGCVTVGCSSNPSDRLLVSSAR